MTGVQLLCVVLFFLTWVGGANVLLVFHCRRLGKPWTAAFQAQLLPFRHFNWREWAILAVLAAVSLALGFIALSLKGR